MDALSSSVPSFTVPTTHRRKSFDVFRHYRPINTSTSSSSSSSAFNLHSPRRNSFSNHRSTDLFAAVPSNRSSPALLYHRPPAAVAVHRRAASGYAAALIDVAKCGDSLDAVRRDVRRVRKWFTNDAVRSILMDSSVSNKEKGEILKEIAEKGKIHKVLGALLKSLVDKNRASLLSQVLEEFERIYDELCGGTARVVLLSSPAHEDGGAFGVAKRVHQMSGASKVQISRRYV